MIKYTGQYNSANVMIDDVDKETASQIYSFLNHPAFGNTYIAIMPDCHAGAGAVIGFTAKMNNYIIPNVVGVDIGCGVLAIKLGNIVFEGKKDLEHLDNFIKQNIPSGFNIRSVGERMANKKKPEDMFDKKLLKRIEDISDITRQEMTKIKGSIGTLGGGNHFIEIDKHNDEHWLLIHSGSRNFGLRIANHFQNEAKNFLKKVFVGADAYKGLEYLPLDMGGDDYIKAMKIAQDFASLNRKTMAELIVGWLFEKECELEEIDTVHNYINFNDNIIRKGAVSANKGERLIIPFNMRDGVALCVGKGNKKWNCSAPHGAGRVLSRSMAKKQLSINEFIDQMVGIYTTTATQSTLDEAPMAYKNKETIINSIEDTVTIKYFMKPIYNFKSNGE